MPEMVDLKELDPIIRELQQMARDNSDVPSMLRMVSNRLTVKDMGLRQVAMSFCFTRAFHAMVNECNPLLRWVGFGGRLDDAQVSELFMPIIKRWLSETPT